MWATSRTVRHIVSMLVAVCLLPVVTQAQWSVAAQPWRADPQSAFLADAMAGDRDALFTLDNRANYNTSDALSHQALISGLQGFDLTQKSSPFSTEYNSRFDHRADRNADSIRAPPTASSPN